MSGKIRPKVIFEGGLGSQLLPLIESLKLQHEAKEFEVDTSYFFPSHISANMVQRSWRLDRYGFDIQSIHELGKGKRKIGLGKRPTNKSLWSFGRSVAASLIPLQYDEVEKLLTKFNLELTSDFSVVHIRRGDYLKVSSKVISDEEIVDIICKTSRFLDRDIFIVSDDKIKIKNHSKLKNLQSERKLKFHFLAGNEIDECIIHDLMRMSNFLICCNSTFSFSAAILSKPSSISIAPIDFFDPNTMQDVNQKFRSAGSFFILD